MILFYKINSYLMSKMPFKLNNNIKYLKVYQLSKLKTTTDKEYNPKISNSIILRVWVIVVNLVVKMVVVKLVKIKMV